jgi:hypothetical protein
MTVTGDSGGMTTFHHRLMKPLRALLTVAVSAVILSTGATASAAPTAPPNTRVVQVSAATYVYCGPELATAYGALASCVEIDQANGRGRTGFYSPIRREWNPESGWMKVDRYMWFDRNVIAVDGPNGRFVGYASFVTAYGRVSFGVQHQATRGRWGSYSLETNRFHPNQGWMPLA